LYNSPSGSGTIAPIDAESISIPCADTVVKNSTRLMMTENTFTRLQQLELLLCLNF